MSPLSRRGNLDDERRGGNCGGGPVFASLAAPRRWRNGSTDAAKHDSLSPIGVTVPVDETVIADMGEERDA